MTASVTVQFFGICTHVTTPSGHRVILPKAGKAQIEEHKVLCRLGVQPHVARLQILTDDVVAHGGECIRDAQYSTWTLDGATLRIKDASAPQRHSALPHDDAFPHLSAYWPDVTLLPEGDRDWDCLFDFPNVTPIPMRMAKGKEGEHATVGVVKVDTPEKEPIIVVQPLVGVEFTIQVRFGTQVTVYSYPDTPVVEDKNADFLLHFLSTTDVPDAPFPPAEPWKECTTVIDTKNLPAPLKADQVRGAFTGPGCSNSAYP
jgi:hypothetical protein